MPELFLILIKLRAKVIINGIGLVELFMHYISELFSSSRKGFSHEFQTLLTRL